MRIWICRFVACALVVMGLEGALDVAAAHADGADSRHTPISFEHFGDADEDGSQPEPDTGHGHCGHYCHGHLGSLPATTAIPACSASSAPLVVTSRLRLERQTAPPTPPPNA